MLLSVCGPTRPIRTTGSTASRSASPTCRRADFACDDICLAHVELFAEWLVESNSGGMGLMSSRSARAARGHPQTVAKWWVLGKP